MVRHVEFVKPAVEGFFGAADGDLDLGAVVEMAGRIGRQRLLGFNGEADGLRFFFGEFLELRLHILIGKRLRLVFCQPIHLVGHSFAAGAEIPGDFQLLAGQLALIGDFEAFRVIETEAQEIDHGEARYGEEDKKFFFAGRH